MSVYDKSDWVDSADWEVTSPDADLVTERDTEGSIDTQNMHTRRVSRMSRPTYQPMELAIQGLACIAMVGTFVRVLYEFNLSSIFLSLPCLAMLAFLARLLTDLRHDPSTLGTVNGALTGIISGFLGSVVAPDGVHLVSKLRPDMPLMEVLRQLELLHIPVVLGSIMYSFCLVFERLPSLRKVYLSTMMALAGAVIFTLGTDTFSDPFTQYEYINTKIFLIMFISLFLIGLLPVAYANQRPWVLCVSCILITTYWQAGFFDSLLWDYTKSRFPIPGSLVGFIYIFLVCGPITDAYLKPTTSPLERVRQWSTGGSNEDLDWLVNTVVWHVITYVIERMSLSYILAQSSPEVSWVDAPLACLMLVGFLGIVSSHFAATPLEKMTIIAASGLLYLSITIVNNTLHNAFFLDTILGLSLFYVTHIAQLFEHNRRVK